MKTKIIGLAIVLVLVAAVIVWQPTQSNAIKIGFITPLSGDLAYWGQSSYLGIKLAEKELQEEGINVEFIVEDGKLDPQTALNAAQKLVNVDKVQAMYTEFNPISVPVASYLKGKNIFNLYSSAPVSPLADNPDTFKSYLNYEESCEEISHLLKQKNYERIAVLKMNLEFGDLCLKGIKKVYGDTVPVEEYNAGDRDLKSQLSKLKVNNPQIIFNVAFQPEALLTLKNMQDLQIKAKFVGLDELEAGILEKNPRLLEGAILFGARPVFPELEAKLKSAFPDKKIEFVQSAGNPYVHAKQLGYALDKCGREMDCIKSELAKAKPEPLIGFKGFKDRIASFDTYIREVVNNKFVPVQ